MAAMAALREKHYGYSLRRILNDAGFEIAEGTLYPLVRRIEQQGLLTGEWHTADGRERRYYSLSPAGVRVLTSLEAEWRQLNSALEKLVSQRP